MKMKENTKSKNDRESGANKLADVLVVLICLGGAFFGIYMFWQDLNKTLSKLSDTPVGIISYKYNGVQRRFSDRFVWSQLQTESPVYNGDIIRTADLSDAIVTFQNENSIDLAENCLIQIFYGADGGRIELSGGTLTANSKNGGLVIASGGKELRLSAGSTVTTNSTGTDLDIQVTSGTVTLNSGGLVQTIEAGTAATITADGRIETMPIPEPLPDGLAVQETPVALETPESPEVPRVPQSPVVAETPAPRNPPARPAPAAVTPLPLLPAPGNMIPAAGFIIDVAEVRRSRSITFSWSAVTGANAYNFTLYRDSVNGTPVLTVRTAGTSYTISDISALDNSNFIWHVEAVNLSGTPRRGQTAESRFAVDIPPPSKPILGVSGTIYGN
jgi:hypothetical protein